MTTSSRAPFYDLFKLIVAIILLLLFIYLVWFRPMQDSPQPVPSTETSTPLPSTPTTAPPTETSISPTETLAPTEMPLPLPTFTETASPVPSPTEATPDETLPPPIIEIPDGVEACAAVSRSQLEVGTNAVIQRRLNFRTSPGIFNNLILTNVPGTQVEVIGGPSCTRYKNGGAYLWWQIKLPNGLTGWSAEASAFGSFYFMEPAQ